MSRGRLSAISGAASRAGQKITRVLRYNPIVKAHRSVLAILLVSIVASCSREPEPAGPGNSTGSPVPPAKPLAEAPRPDVASVPSVGAPQSGAQTPANTETPGAELMRLITDIKKNVPKEAGLAGQSLAANYYLQSRDKLMEFARKYAGLDEAIYARTMRATLSIAAGAPEDAEAELSEVLQMTAGITEGKRAPLRIEALQFYAQVVPQKALPLLEQLLSSPDAAVVRKTTKILRATRAVLSLKPGNPPPAFDITSVDGVRFSPESLKGRAVLFYFWSSNVRTSIDFAADLNRAVKKYDTKKIISIGINMDGSEIRSVPGGAEPVGAGAEAVSAFAQQAGLPGAQVYDGRGYDGDVAEIFAINTLPSAVLIDADGIVRSLGAPSSGFFAALDEVAKK